MQSETKRIRILYSFPHRLGAQRICTTAWHQVEGAKTAGADITVYAGSAERAVPEGVKLRTTLAWKKLRIPYRLLGGQRACYFHDWFVARSLKQVRDQVDVVHVWPLGALYTIQEAKRLGIPTVLERPNAHTRFAYDIVQKECKRIGVKMPSGHEHSYKRTVLEREEKEFALADRLLCPSDFVVQTFLEMGFSAGKLARTQYGYDDKIFYAQDRIKKHREGLKILFAGGCAPRKGLHFALDAWLQSSAHKEGTFLIAGAFIPGYAERLSAQLSHPSVKTLGHRNDLPELMRGIDILVLPTLEEGSALVTYEARASGCVLLVSDAAGAVCQHEGNALVHNAGDVKTLTRHLSLLHENRALLENLRVESLATVKEITWQAAGEKLLKAYKGSI